MSSIELNSVTMRYPDETVAVEKLTLRVDEKETLVLIGPSGSGKTTTLRIIAGLETPTSGQVYLDQKDVSMQAPRDRNVAMMFQSDALYPHLSVRGNLSFGLQMQTGNGLQVNSGKWLRGLIKRWMVSLVGSKAMSQRHREIQELVRQTAEKLSIEMLLDRMPHQLSGGERQRVALGRAMVRNPAAFLLDEPFSRLDAPLARDLRRILKRLFRELGKPVLFVTHDQSEAMTLADRIVVMDRGKLIQVGKPLEIYQRPANLFVAKFVGDVPMNVLSRAEFECGEGLQVPSDADKVGFRAEHVKLCGNDSNESNLRRIVANSDFRILDIERMGDHARVYLVLSEGSDASIATSENVESELVARCEFDTNVRVGDRVRVSVLHEHLTWFDSAGRRLES